MSGQTIPDAEQRRTGSAPVIEQAKGIIMARYRCGPEEAFEILCGMSQYTNVKLRVLAERMIRQVSPSAPGDDLAPVGQSQCDAERPPVLTDADRLPGLTKARNEHEVVPPGGAVARGGVLPHRR